LGAEKNWKGRDPSGEITGGKKGEKLGDKSKAYDERIETTT